MFTGLIEAVGDVDEIQRRSDGLRLRVRTTLGRELVAGDSIAVNGVCLTATDCNDRGFSADVGPETVRVTTLGEIRHGGIVNLERPMRADARLGGHFVQGHVDGTGVLDGIRHDGESHWLTVAFPGDLSPFLIRKGSIAVDGISLTVADLRERRFDVMIIPFTWEHTNLRALQTGDRVNLECDMIGKYVARSIELAAGAR
jgi:riboflavin synthase